MKIEEELEDDVVFGGKQMVTAGGSRRVEAKRAVVLVGARVLFYPTLLYNVFRHKIQPAFRWWDPVDQYLLLGAVPFPKDVLRLKKLGVGAVITLNEPYETLVPSSLYRAHGIEHLVIPTRDYLFAPSFVDINWAVEFIHKNACCGRTTYVHCKAGRGRSTTIVLCYLVKHKNMAPAYALEYVRSIRPRVALAASQWKAVQEYSKRLLDPSAHSPSVDAVLITKSDLRLDISAHSPSGDAVLTTTADLQMDALSPSGEAVLVTKADLEGYYSSCGDAGKLAVVPRIKARPMMARLSCLFASLKVFGAGGPVTRQLTEAHAC